MKNKVETFYFLVNQSQITNMQSELQPVHVFSSPSRVRVLHVSSLESESESHRAGFESESSKLRVRVQVNVLVA